MRETRILMGMPITVEVIDGTSRVIDNVFGYLDAVDQRFSTYKHDSEISAYNRGEILLNDLSTEMREVLQIAVRTKQETEGYFDIKRPDGTIDPSGIVKGWAICNAANRIKAAGFTSFYVEAGGDIQSGGLNGQGHEWRVGIRSPFNTQDIIKVISPRGHGVATSGSYARGQHIYNPHTPEKPIQDVVSITVIGSDVLEADCFATAAFAMGSQGIYFIERVAGLEAYLVNAQGIATQTTGFGAYVCHDQFR